MTTTTKQRVSEQQRRQVLELRRRLSLREVATATGLPLGTVKTLVSRSGAFRDNEQHRALFSLPPIRESAETLPAVPELPPQEVVTGDKEVDAVLWLRSVIGTGQAALIERAMEAAKKIETPLAVLERRYRDHLAAAHPGNLFAALSSFGFADLEGLAAGAIERERRRVEAVARFDNVLADTEAEAFCIQALRGLKRGGMLGDYDKDKAAQRFQAHPELLPHTMGDCLHELDYWRQLYWLRNAVDRDCSEGPPQAYARERFVFGLLAEMRPRNRDEAKAVLRYLIEHQQIDGADGDAILENLIG
ncbi:hypothetical protein SAMN04244573_03060 [Azotobacter beijerinckii]|uniref:Uncharacterized protein n=1 Tax=Azotobacter beijerinckii TaxID=170623 RepID=A0A1H9M672_9GAMM|nr:hypothetical protein [Azotobacter beijerinckii]SER19061.1 hypothetical protein SAMN04244573_03060 [Azotobacter beijerinckii]